MSQKPESSEERKSTVQKLRAKKFSRYYLLMILVLILVIFFNMIKIFLVPIIIAAVFTALFYPLYEGLLKRFPHKKTLASLLCCLLLLLGFLVPAYFLANLVSSEAVQLYQSAEAQISSFVEKGGEGLLGTLTHSRLMQRLGLDQINWQDSLQQIAQAAGKLMAAVINKTSKETFQLLTNLAIILFTMFYFFRDGDKLIDRLKYLSPLDDMYEEALIYRFVSVSRATIKGTLLIGLIQGTLGGLLLWAFGITSPILWGMVMVILSIIPFIGAWLVLYPAAIIQIILGHVWQGIAIALITSLVISNIDNLLRPRLVGRSARMHDLMVFFSTLGGINMFGVMGFIIGPVIAVLLLTILDIYSIEFKSQLDLAQGDVDALQLQDAFAEEEIPDPKTSESN